MVTACTDFETPVAFPACTTWQWTSRVTSPEPTIVQFRQRLSPRVRCIRVSAKWVLRAPKCHAVAKCRRWSCMNESVAGRSERDELSPLRPRWEWSADEIKRIGRVAGIIAEHLTTLSEKPVFRPFPAELAAKYLGLEAAG